MGADSHAIEELKQKKIKIWSSVTTAVTVIQDDAAADSDATLKIDNAFLSGHNYSWGGIKAGGMERMTFELDSLTADGNGKEFTFEVQDFTNYNSLGLSPADRVEFSAEVGAALPVGGAWASWHSASQTASSQIKLFYGYIDDVRRVENDRGQRVFQVRCIDPIRYANKIKGMQDVSEGLTIPWLIFNVDEPTDPDWFVAIKNRDTAAAAATRYRYGQPLNPAAAQMTLAQILDYLQVHYQSDLYYRGIIAGASDDLFDADEIAAFTDIPPKTVFENTGFGDIVRGLIRSHVPDHDLVVDPRTRVWHIRPVRHDLLSDGDKATINSVVVDKLKWYLDDASMFAISGAGSTVRLMSATDLFQTEVANVTAVVLGGSQSLELTAPVGFSYVAGDFILPMYSEHARPPLLTVDLEGDTRDHSLSVDLQGVYSAVSIVGRRAKYEEKSVKQTVGGGPSGSRILAQIVAGYDPAYLANYEHTAHAERRTDRGQDGNGIAIDEIETIGSAPNEFTRIYFSEAHSAYEDDHDIQNESTGASEWTGTAFHVLTQAGAATDIESANVSAIIDFFARAGWMDGPANTIRRYRIDLDRDITATIPSLQDEVNDGAPDKFQMSSSEIHKPRNPNLRWAVGRVWRIESTSASNDADDIQPGMCSSMNHPSLQAGTGGGGYAGLTMSQQAIPADQTTTAPRTFQEQVDYHNLNPADPLNGGVPRAWVIPKPPPPPTWEEICAQLPPSPPPPREFTMNVKKFTNEVHKARVPGAGYAGLANLYYKHAEELVLTTDSYEHESQDDQFSLVAASIWRKVSQPHYTGELNLRGVTRWLGLSDLGFRVAFGGGATGFATGQVTEQRRFWGLCSSLRFDFRSGATSLSFDSRGFGDDLGQELFEKRFVSETAELKSIKDKQKHLEANLKCLASRPKPPAPATVQGCDVSHGPMSVSARVAVTPLKDAAVGGVQVSIGVKGPHTVNPLSVTGSIGFHPPYLVEELYTGGVVGVSVPGGAHVSLSDPGAGSTATLDDSNGPEIATLPQYSAERADELLQAGVLGGSLAVPVGGQVIQLTTGSTTTVLQLAFPIHADARYNGGHVSFSPDGGSEARPKYTVATHTATTITLSAAMTENIPPSGSTGMIRPVLLPTLDAEAFSDGGKPFKDSAGNWFVAEGGTLTAAALTGNVLGSSSGSPVISVGAEEATHNAKGTWNFSGVTGLSGVITTADLVSNGGLEIVGGELQLDEGTISSTVAGVAASAAGAQVVAATTSLAGALTAADKVKVDAIPNLVWEMWLSLHGSTVIDGGSGTLAAANPGISSSSDYDGYTAIYNFTSSQKRGMAFNLAVPGDLDVGAVVTAKAYYRLSGAPDDGDVAYMGIDARAVADNEATTSGGTLFGITGEKVITAYSSGDMVVDDLGTLFGASTLAVGDFVKGVIWRDSTGETDTYDGTVQFIGIRLIGTRAKA